MARSETQLLNHQGRRAAVSSSQVALTSRAWREAHRSRGHQEEPAIPYLRRFAIGNALHTAEEHALPLFGLLLVLLLFYVAARLGTRLPPITHATWSSRTQYLVFTLSVILNFLALGVLVHVIKGRGGLAYLKGYLKHDVMANMDAAFIGRQMLFDLMPHGGGRPIVFMGDSITASCEWSEMFGNRSLILNRGIGGDTSAGAAMRAESIGALHPLAVFLMIGTNDLQLLHCRPEQTVSNWRSIIELIHRKSPETVIYAQSILPTGTPKFNDWSMRVNQQVSGLADGRSVIFVDLRSAFLLDNSLNPEYTADGIHLNGKGYLVWKKQIETIVRGLIREQASNIKRRRAVPAAMAAYK